MYATYTVKTIFKKFGILLFSIILFYLSTLLTFALRFYLDL